MKKENIPIGYYPVDGFQAPKKGLVIQIIDTGVGLLSKKRHQIILDKVLPKPERYKLVYSKNVGVVTPLFVWQPIPKLPKRN